MDAALQKLYDDNLEPGAKELFLAARTEGIQITLQAVKEWIKGQEHHAEHAPNGMDKPRNWFKITDVPNSFAVDAILKGDFNKSQNKGYRGFLLFIELTTRKVYAYPVKSGSENSPPEANESLEIFKSFDAVRKAEGHPVMRISGDNGKEFDNGKVQDFLHKKFITTYFHRPEDHRANGTLNVAARFLRKRIGNDRIEWLPRLGPAVALWNKHVLRTVKDSPNVLEENKLKRQDIRFEALAHNNDVWNRTSFDDHPVVKRYLRKNTVDRGLFAKEGKNFVGDFQVGKRQGNSYQLSKPDGTLLSNAYRPYELRKTGTGLFDEGKRAYQEQQTAQAANKAAARGARRVRQELGAIPEAKKLPLRKKVVPTLLNPAAPKVKAAPKPVKLDESSVPIKILDHDWKGENLRFLIQWKDTPEFRKKWAKDPAVDLVTQTSWRPAQVLTEAGRTNAVVGEYLKTVKSKKDRDDIKRKMGL